MKIAIIGAKGMLGRELLCLLKGAHPKVAVDAYSHHQLDITKPSHEIKKIIGNVDIIYNCAAYTKVDLAESEKDDAFKVNEYGAKMLAEVALGIDAKLVHISTDFVFDGCFDKPIDIATEPNPLSVYGLSKLAGEKKIIESGCKYLIVRTSWLYGAGGKNFVDTIYDKAKVGEDLRVVNDQIGRLTYTEDLAEALVALVDCDAKGVFHAANQGIVTWYDVAAFILDFLKSSSMLEPVLTSEYPTPAKRPSYSVLDISKTEMMIDRKMPLWQDSLTKYLQRKG